MYEAREMAMEPNPDRYQPTPEELKLTPNTAMEMRFGRGGDARPHRSIPAEADKRPVNMRRVRNRTNTIYGVIFSVIAAAMVAGALSIALPSPFSEVEEVPAETPVADDAPAEDDRELQGGVEVRRGIGK